MRAVQDDIAQFQRQRDITMREIQRPNLDEGTKQALRNSLAELDRVITSYKASLKRLEESPDEPVPNSDPRGRRPNDPRRR